MRTTENPGGEGSFDSFLRQQLEQVEPETGNMEAMWQDFSSGHLKKRNGWRKWSLLLLLVVMMITGIMIYSDSFKIVEDTSPAPGEKREVNQQVLQQPKETDKAAPAVENEKIGPATPAPAKDIQRPTSPKTVRNEKVRVTDPLNKNIETEQVTSPADKLEVLANDSAKLAPDSSKVSKPTRKGTHIIW